MSEKQNNVAVEDIFLLAQQKTKQKSTQSYEVFGHLLHIHKA